MPGYAPGTIVVSQRQRSLYFVIDEGQALRYPVAVGKMGKQWHGIVQVDGKYVEPAWAPRQKSSGPSPGCPTTFPAVHRTTRWACVALTLSGDQYAIHGTNRPGSIGTAASFGCIRMYNRDIVDLYDRVSLGAPVVMLP